jgi:predicted dehydrogenase
MNFAVIGLGSMGKRRVRNLLALGYSNIAGWDIRADRRLEAKEKYGIKVYESFENLISSFAPRALLISVSPDKHMEYAYNAFENGIHCFIEASVTDAEKIKLLAQKNSNNKLIIAPSCTMKYYLGPQIIRDLLNQRIIGELLYVNYHSGQYLPDWHPWEDIKDFYVSKKETGGCREIVPFELTWLNSILGKPRAIALAKDKLTSMDADIDDIYCCTLKYGKVICNLTVDVIARPKAVREFRALGSEGIIEWSYENEWVRYSTAGNSDWTVLNLNRGTVENGYINPEEPYINEIKDFTKAILEHNPEIFPNNLTEDFEILQTLTDLEKINIQ